MKKYKIMIIGAVEAGKSSFMAALNGDISGVKKTQTFIYNAMAMDTPGEYMENPRMYRHVINAAQDAEYIVCIQDGTNSRNIYPPGFAKSLRGKTIGVITKIDKENVDIERSTRFLKMLCIDGPIFQVSAITGEGISEIKEYLGL